MTMKNRIKSFTITFLVAVFCLSNILGAPGFSAQAAGKNDPTFSAQLSPNDVTVQVSESEDDMDQILAVQAGTDQYWAHGNTLMLESQTSGVSVAHYGFGSEVRATSAQNGQGIAWVHFSVPTPRLVEGTSAKLSRILISYSGDVLIDKVDVWDGPTRLVSTPTTSNVVTPGVLTVNLAQPANITYGIGVSVHLTATCSTDFCTNEKITLRAAGAEFTR